jgi:hypothetical protein
MTFLVRSGAPLYAARLHGRALDAEADAADELAQLRRSEAA